ncbi:MAG: V-type ATP synthase subunit E [Negativicutes bacterium]|nr:V-type ATP synthase subunit E [Negativicutes bacterium]
MSLESILSKIILDGQTEGSRLISEAQVRAAAIRQQGQDEAEIRRQQILQQANREADEYELPLLSIAKLEARKSRLLAQQEVIQGAFDRAQAELRSLPQEESQALLKQLLLEAAVTGNEEIMVEEQDRKLYSPSFLAKVNLALMMSGRKPGLKLSEQTAITGGGFILRAEDIEINATYPALIKEIRDELEPQVVKILFGQNE